MIAAVEGVDCTGKGEICKRLAQRLGAVLYKTPPDEMREQQNHINATASDEDHYRWFLGMIQAASAEIGKLSQIQNVVLDRYWMTTVVYHRVMGVAANLRDFGPIIMPTVTIYLTVTPEVQSVRMATRGMSPGDVRMDGRQHLIRQAYDEVIPHAGRVIRVDTSVLTPDELVDLIMGEIEHV